MSVSAGASDRPDGPLSAAGNTCCLPPKGEGGVTRAWTLLHRIAVCESIACGSGEDLQGGTQWGGPSGTDHLNQTEGPLDGRRVLPKSTDS